MKICLINPAIYVFEKDIVPIVPPIGLACLGAGLRERGDEVVIIDSPLEGNIQDQCEKFEKGKKLIRYGYTPEDLADKLIAMQPDVVGISNNMSVNEAEALECAEVVKKIAQDIYVVCGGINVTARNREILSHPCVDFIIAGEGDEVLQGLINRLENNLDFKDIPYLGYKQHDQITIPEKSAFVEDLDTLPMPAWDLLKLEEYFARPFPFTFLKHPSMVLLTSRGCIRDCIFCSGRKFLGKWRGRSPKNIHQETIMLKQQYGIREIQFMDANINIDTNRFLEICEIMKKEQLAWNPVGGLYINKLDQDIVTTMIKSGCYYMTLAIEHGALAIQKYIGKINPIDKAREITEICQKYGVWTHASFIIGFPDETREDALECLNYATKSGVDSISVFTATPLPGTRLFKEVSRYINLNMSDIRFLSDNYIAKNMTKEELIVLRKKILRSFSLYKIFSELSHPFRLLSKLTKNNFMFGRMLFQNVKRFLLFYFK